MQNTQNANQAVSPVVIDELNGSSGWVLFLAILIFIGSALLILFSIIMLFAGIGLSLALPPEMSNIPIGAIVLGITIIIAGIGVIYLMQGIYLSKFKSAISRLVADSSIISLQSAVEQQRKFWKLTAIVMLITTLFTVAWTAFALMYTPEDIMQMFGFSNMWGLPDDPSALTNEGLDEELGPRPWDPEAFPDQADEIPAPDAPANP